jgi:photosystem II stability/assembly factor-like uncharacterized protein
MTDHRDRGVQADEDALLRRWYAASSQSLPLPSAELLAGGDRARRGRRTGRNLAMGAVAIVAIVAGIVGAGAWASFRAASGSSGSPSAVAPASSTPSSAPTGSTQQSLGPTFQGPTGPALAEHESILQMHRTTSGGWLLTGSRLLMTDGSSWRDCWRSTSGDATSPNLHAVVAGIIIRVIAGMTLWTSTDGCATWAQSALPIAPDGVAFPTDMVGYIAVGDQSGSNREAHVFRTADAGQHWTATAGNVKAIPGPYGFYGPLTLSFADADHGWLTDSHTIWATSNGGRTWTKATLPVPGSIRGKLDFITAQMVGVDGSVVLVAKYDATPGMDGARGQRVFYRTVDRGAHWTAISVVEDPGMLTMSLVDPTTWVVLNPSEPPSFQTTTDAGSTWHTITVRQRWPFNGGPIDFVDSLHGWMVVSEPEPPCPQPSGGFTICDYAFAPPIHLVATDDGGATWVELKP